MNTEWRTVSIAPEYRVSSDGQVRSVYSRKPLKGGRSKSGYRRLVMCTDGRRVYRTVAQLVCIAFHGPRPEGCVVRHIDGSRDNDAADNLEWGTQRENMADKVRHGTAQRGESHPHAKLTEAKVLAIRASSESAADLAVRFGVAKVTIYFVRSRRLWKHI